MFLIWYSSRAQGLLTFKKATVLQKLYTNSYTSEEIGIWISFNQPAMLLVAG